MLISEGEVFDNEVCDVYSNALEPADAVEEAEGNMALNGDTENRPEKTLLTNVVNLLVVVSMDCTEETAVPIEQHDNKYTV